MIARNTLQLTSKDGVPLLYLAPFGAEELARYIPASPDIMPFESNEIRELYATSTPASLLAAEQWTPHVQSWGVYEETPSVESFIGTVDMSHKRIGNPEKPTYTTIIQEVGTLILAPEKRGKGLGSLAKLAVMQYAYEQEATLGFVADTSEHNLASQRSLEKVGFALIDTRPRYVFPDGEQTQHWMLASPKVQASLARQEGSSAGQQHALKEGWNRFTAAMYDLSVEEKG